ncbi:iron chelate uptake ABC transporter family permease subunit [Escherichia coli]
MLRNPLAEPTTLGVATGAQLGITVTTLGRSPVLWRASLRWWALVSLA